MLNTLLIFLSIGCFFFASDTINRILMQKRPFYTPLLFLTNIVGVASSATVYFTADSRMSELASTTLIFYGLLFTITFVVYRLCVAKSVNEEITTIQ